MMRISLSRLLPLTIGTMALVLGGRLYSVTEAIGASVDADPSGGPLVSSSHADQPDATTMPQTEPPPASITAPVAHNACDYDAACRTKPAVKKDTGTDPALIREIAQRQRQLAAETVELDERKRALDAAEATIEQKMAAIAASREEIRKSRDTQNELSEDDVAKLVKIYQAMKPVDAASIFNVLDLRVGTRLLGRMDARHASAIMGAMQPQRAILATQMLIKIHPPVASANERAG